MTRNPILAFAMLLPWVGCHKATTEESPPRPVKVQLVESPVEEGGLRYSASIQPNQQVQLAFKVGGYVREIAQRKDAAGKLRNLQQGDDVQAGTVLTRIREADYQKKVEEARAQRSGAAGNLEKARADMSRAQHLYDNQSLTRTDYDASRAALTVAQSQLKALKSELASLNQKMANLAAAQALRELEDEGDRLSREAIAELFRSGADPLTIIRWKDIHEQLEEAVDACENAADVLEAILVKNR